MNRSNINHFDLNLMKVFVAIWDERSISGAGSRLGLTQPAVSHSLKRLRDHFMDPLFLRVGNKMEPTEAAKELYEPFSTAMRIASTTLLNYGVFVPETSNRTFNIAMSDVSEFYCLPQILQRLQDVAPSVRVRTVQLEATSIAAALRNGQVDIAMGFLPDLDDAEFASRLLLKDRFVCLVQSGHPMAGHKLTIAEFSQLNFVEVTIRATGFQMVDARLNQCGAVRRSSARIENFTTIPELVRSSQFAALFPYSIACRVNANGDFSLLEIPFEIPSIDIALHVHAKLRNDSGILWMQDLLAEAMRDLSENARRAPEALPPAATAARNAVALRRGIYVL